MPGCRIEAAERASTLVDMVRTLASENEPERASDLVYWVEATRRTIDSWRSDLLEPADLSEEVARLDGYDQIPSVLPVAPPGNGLTAAQRRRRTVARALAEAGYVQALCYPFVSDAAPDQLGLPAEGTRRAAGLPAHPPPQPPQRPRRARARRRTGFPAVYVAACTRADPGLDRGGMGRFGGCGGVGLSGRVRLQRACRLFGNRFRTGSQSGAASQPDQSVIAPGRGESVATSGSVSERPQWYAALDQR